MCSELDLVNSLVTHNKSLVDFPSQHRNTNLFKTFKVARATFYFQNLSKSYYELLYRGINALFCLLVDKMAWSSVATQAY